MILSDLPRTHILRNIPLGLIGAEYRTMGKKKWFPIAQFKIAGNTFNELGPTWTTLSEFRTEKEEADAFPYQKENTC